jgi:hypothetical protein
MIQKSIKQFPLLTFLSLIIGFIILVVAFNRLFESGMPPMMHGALGIGASLLFAYIIYTSSGTNVELMGFEFDKGMGVYIVLILLIFFAFSGSN